MSIPVDIIVPNQPEIKVFYASGAVKVTAFGLIGDDCISFKLVRETSDSPRFTRSGCFASTPTSNEVEHAADYMIGNCKPTMYEGRNTIIIPRAGSYLPVINGADSDGGLTVQVELVEDSEFSDREIGIDPCGCPCKSTAWVWSGSEQCRDGNVWREEESNCGNLRWVLNRAAGWTDSGETRCSGNNFESKLVSECGGTEWRVLRSVSWVATGETRCENHAVEAKELNDCGVARWVSTGVSCGYSPSVPLVLEVYDGCGGGQQIGYMYHPSEERDPAATVAVHDCDGVVLGYIYPTASTGRTLPVGDCDSDPIGYALNYSSTAPSYAQDFADASCGC